MNILEQYIKMCDCEEIQSQWHKIISYGDKTNEGTITALLTYYEDETWEVKVDDDFNNSRDLIWLPRQDQLQDMISHNKSGVLLLLSLFSADVYQWKTSYKEQFIESMEQLWLAWVMEKKFNKKWNNEKWEIVI